MENTITTTRVALPSLGFSTRVLCSGRGAPVLLLHGAPDNAGEWRRVMSALGDDVACFAPDLPGFGECDEPPASFDYSHAAHEAFLDDLLDGLGVREPLVLVVHDIGGVVGLPWAMKRRSRIAGVVVTNTVIFENFPWFPQARFWARTGRAGKALARLQMALVGIGGGAPFRRLFGRVSPELPPEELQRITREFACDAKSKRSTLRLFRQMIRPAYFDGADGMVRTLLAEVPTRVVWGTPDPYIPAHYADVFSAASPEIIDGGGHWVPISNAGRVAAAVHALARSATR